MKPAKRKSLQKSRAVRLRIFGVVQGVGFRPFIYRLAEKFQYNGWVKNIGFGVEVRLESKTKTDFGDFLRALEAEKPPLAQLEDISAEPASYQGLEGFRIEKSLEGESFVFISPDIATCESCFKEVMTPAERRFHYPFTNCTDCGPRYTIVKELPYDRKKTTMARFKMCRNCAAEYNNPLDRRYHAQPIACPVCGPEISLRNARSGRKVAGGIEKAISLIRLGKILAVKGLGGFHLVCDARNRKAVARLRKIKERERKPLALMAFDLDTIEKYADLTPAERRELLSGNRPIVLLRKKKDIPGIAPHLNEIGFMLPYTPLHHLILKDLKLIVATSSNKKDAPIIKEEGEGIRPLCDYLLSHNRPIEMRADDSVVKVAGDSPLFLRRARGFVPYPQSVPPELRSSHQILALGGELKDTVSVYKNGYVITSQFLGDLDEYQNYGCFQETIDHLCRLFDVKPEYVVSDLHPNFHTTRFAQKSGLPHFQVQHHFAHVLAPLLEHKIPSGTKVLGVSFDGYGYGSDGAAWGGEFLIADYLSFERWAHFEYLPLPGGDLAAKQPWRMAVSYLRQVFGHQWPRIEALERLDKMQIQSVLNMIDSKINSPLTSSCGRLFDAVSFLLGISPPEVEFEAEAPMRLEAKADEKIKTGYEFTLLGNDYPLRVSFVKTIKSIVKDLGQRVPKEKISAKFHNTLARLIIQLARRGRKDFGVDTCVLVGGVFLNKFLLMRSIKLLKDEGFRVLRPLKYSPNDESLSLGQIAYVLAKLKAGNMSSELS